MFGRALLLLAATAAAGCPGSDIPDEGITDPDLSVAVDLRYANGYLDSNARLPDLRQVDFRMPDVAMPDVAMPDVAMPDVAMPDLAMPDVAMPDLAQPDLAPPFVDRWRRDTPANSPPALTSHWMVWDAARRRVVLYGGENDDLRAVADTWEWDGVNWTKITTASSPGPRHAMGLVWDADRGRTVLFGGTIGISCGSDLRNDTWEYDGTNWTQVPTAAAPTPRYWAGMVYESARRRTLLYGGWDCNARDDTWQYDGTNWTRLTPAHSPPRRYWHGMTYDARRARAVVYGGYALNPGGALDNSADTWEWDGADWTDRTTTPSPPARYSAHLGWDPDRGVTLLFGGWHKPDPGSLDDTWEWDGVLWRGRNPPAPLPGGRHAHPIVWDGVRHRLMLFGGYGPPVYPDQWVYGN